MGKPPSVVVACDACAESGVIPDAGGVGIVCAQCGGNGYTEFKYKPFTGLKKRSGITRVRRSGQGLWQGEVAEDAGIAYEAFLKGKRP